MKNIFRIFAAVFAGVVLFASCLNEAAPLASSVSVDKAELNPVGIGAVPSVVKVTADGDWFAISSSEWITVEPANGVSGTTEVTIKVADNVDSYKELCGPRSGSVSFCYGTSGVAAVTVNQKGENGLDASRTYSLVTKTEDLTAGSYIFVYDVDKKKEAMKPSSEITDSYYGYLMTGAVNDPVDNVITMPNGLSGFSLEAVEGGFKIKQADGRYLFQSGTYASFYATSDAAKAAVWAISFNEKGYAEVKNTTQAGQIMHFSSYGNVEATTKEVKDEEKPMLYKDAKPASDEILSVPEKVTVLNTATSATIEVTSNKTWKVRNHDEWIKTFTANGEGNGTIEITFDAYEGDTENRTAEFLVIGETTNFTVVLTQMKSPTTIAEIYPQITSTSSSTFSVNLKEPAVVTYVNGGNAFIEDKTGGILYYNKSHGLKVGDRISGVVEGTGKDYSKLIEILSITNEPKIESGAAPEYPEVTLADILDNYDRYMSCVVKIKGIKVTDGITNSDRDGKIEQGDKNIALRVQDKNANPVFNVTKDSEGDLLCIPSIFNTTKQLGIWEAAHFKATKVGAAINMPATLSMNVEDVKALGATTNSTATITYVSSDPAVATVDAEGKVTALKVGETTITASVAAADIYTAVEATCKVTVSEKPAAPTATVTFDAVALNLANQTALTSYDVDPITFAFDGGGNSNNPKWYNSGSAVRCYPKNTITVSGKTIVKVEVGVVTGNTALDLFDGATKLDNFVWEGTSDSVVLTFDPSKTSGQTRFKTITVTYVE